MFRRAALLLCLALPMSASAGKKPKDPCKKVKLQEDDFGGPAFWEANAFGNRVITLKPTNDGNYTLRVPAQTSELTTVVLPAGATSEIAFKDGTVWTDTHDEPIPGTLVNTQVYSLWYFSVPVSPARLEKLAESRMINARLKVEDTFYGNEWFIHYWTEGLQRAAACMLSRQAD